MTASTPGDLPSTINLPSPSNEPGSVLVRVMEECLIKLEAGEAIDRTALLAAHPELADQLETCLASLQFIHQAARSEDSLPARLGDFRIIREVGRGGMGVVYEAEQVSLKRRVALKVLRFGSVTDVEAMQRFQREAETVAALHHTNIVPVFAIGSEQSVHYYAMQFIDGRSLRELCHREAEIGGRESATGAGGSVGALTIAQWGLQAADALAHAHQRNVVHRDIKPSNLILGDDGRIWLTDFGLAKRLDDVTLSLSGALLGTPRYMSPEQASALNQPVDHRTDIYSLGATLYELVTHQPLFDSQSPHVVIAQILSVEPMSPRLLAPELPRDLETIILKCLSKNAAQRYQSAQELADDLRAFIEGRAIRARRISVMEQGMRWIKHNRKQLVSTIAAIAVTMVAVIGGALFWRQYDAMQNGRLTLATKSGPLTAEVLNDAGELVVPSFTVPNEQPVAIPSGDYQLRVSGRGALSKTARFHLMRTQELKLDVDLDRNEYRAAQPLHGASGYEFVDFGDGPDLIVLPKSPNANAVRESSKDLNQKTLNETTLQRVSLKTGQVIWSIDVSQKSPDLKELLKDSNDETQWYSSTVFGWQMVGQKSLNVLKPMPDLDRDGTPDLVWLLHQGRCLFAVSGKTGKPLWWQSPEGRVVGENKHSAHAAVFKNAELIPLKQDGVDEPMLVISERLDDPQTSSRQVTLRAIRLRDRETIWRLKLDPQKRDGTDHPLRIATVGLQAAGRNGESSAVVNPQIVVAHGGSVLLLDALSGKQIGQAYSLKSAEGGDETRCYEMKVQDLDGDQLPELVVLSGPRPNSLMGTLQVLSVSPTDGLLGTASKDRRQWSVEVGRPQQFAELKLNVENDLNGDGVREVLVSAPKTDLDCQVLDGSSGKELWRRRIPGHYSESRNSAPVVGDDINGDGWRDVFMLSIKPHTDFRFNTAKSLYADCFSGKDGRSLWWSRQPADERVSPFLPSFEYEPQWWAHGPNGGPVLLASIFSEPSHRVESRLWTIDARNGQFLETGTGLTRPELVDLNHDGRSELCAFALQTDSHNHHQVFTSSGELKVFRGAEPIGWRRFGNWVPLTDLDGDGLSELWQPNHRWHDLVPIVSGKDGSVFTTWHWQHDDVQRTEPLPETYSAKLFKSRPSRAATAGATAESSSAKTPAPAASQTPGPKSKPLNDLDGDGWPDLLAYGIKNDSYGDREVPAELPLGIHVVSGKTGKKLWQKPLVKAPQWGQRTWLLQHPGEAVTVDLEGDGKTELVMPYVWESSSNQQPKQPGLCSYEVAVIDLQTGRLKWRADMHTDSVEQASHFWSSGETAIRFLGFADLDGDSILDFVTSIEPSSWHSRVHRPRILQARSGRDGHLLWPELRGKFQRTQWDWGNFMQGAVADLDGDGPPEVVVFDFLSSDQTGEPAWKGEFEVLVLNAATGKLRFRKSWAGSLARHGNSASMEAPQLLALRSAAAASSSSRDSIVITKAKVDPNNYTQPTEDWLLRAPTADAGRPQEAANSSSQATQADGVGELEIAERFERDRNDYVSVLDLNEDGADELVALRHDLKHGFSKPCELRVSRGLNDSLWTLADQSHHGMTFRLLDHGRVLLAGQNDRAQWITSDGKRVAMVQQEGAINCVMTSTDSVLREFVQSTLAPKSSDSTQQATRAVQPRFVRVQDNVAWNRLLLSSGQDKRRVTDAMDADPSLRRTLARLQPDPRLLRKLPWVEQDIGRHGMLILLASGVTSLLLAVLPFVALRFGWRERRAVWPLVWSAAGVLVWWGGLWQITYSLQFISSDHVGSLAQHGMALFMLMGMGLPLAISPFVAMQWFAKRRQQPAIALGVSMLVSSVGLMTLLLYGDYGRLHETQSYDWRGWYSLLPMGCYGGYCLWLAGGTIKSAWRKRRGS